MALSLPLAMLRHFLQMVLQEDKESSIKEQMQNKPNPQKKRKKACLDTTFSCFYKSQANCFFVSS